MAAPVGPAPLLEPDGVVLADVGLVAVHPRQLDVVEAVPGPVEPPPVVEVAQQRLAFDRGLVGLGPEGLEVGLADEGGVVAGVAEQLADRVRSSGSLVPRLQHPCQDGYCPVMIDARLGEQVGLGQYERSTAAPAAANRSRFGVCSAAVRLPSSIQWC